MPGIWTGSPYTSEDDANKVLSTSFFLHNSNIFLVPLISFNTSIGFSRVLLTPTTAEWWKTQLNSCFLNTLTRSDVFVSPFSIVKFLLSKFTFFFEPVEKLSKQITSWPFLSKFSHRWLPINPAPPVTKHFIFLFL